MERALQFGAAMALAWVGVGLLRSQPVPGLAVLACAVVALVGLPQLLARAQGIGRGEASPASSAPADQLADRAPAAYWLVGAAAACGIAAPWVNTLLAAQPWAGLLAWAAAIGLLLAGAWRLTTPRPAISRASLRAARWEIATVLALTLLALALRAYLLERLPQNFGGDEGEMGMNARAVLHGGVRDAFATGWLSHPNLWFFLQALALRVFGDTIFGLRMLSALLGAATVPALYLFARPLYGRQVALLAAALLATYHFHIHFSRLGVNNIVDPLVALLAFAAFLHGTRDRAAFSFALAGVTLGLAQHFYMGSRLAPLVVAAALLHQLILGRRRVWELRWQLGLMALAFLVGFGPLLNHFLSHPTDFTARLGMVGMFQTGWFDQQRASGLSTAQILLDQARNAFGAWTWQPDRSAWYDPKIPLLDRASSALFLLGLGVTIANWRRLDAAMLLAWLAGTAVLGGILLINTPESPRYITSVPVVCLLIALALAQIGTFARKRARLGRRAAWGLAGAAAALLALWNVNFYFREYTPRNTYGWFNTEVGTSIGAFLAWQPDDVFVYFFGPPAMYYGNASIRFQAPDVAGADVYGPITSAGDLPPPPEGRRPIFVFLNHRAAELAIVQAHFPNGSTQQVRASNGGPLVTIYVP
jgi:4-amino-4-deoxy-L-arabinose transferase-like glycosyltransferase